jgi:hypothetical protein
VSSLNQSYIAKCTLRSVSGLHLGQPVLLLFGGFQVQIHAQLALKILFALLSPPPMHKAFYSYLSATIGSTREARRAGT